jgi:hypothetical protein
MLLRVQSSYYLDVDTKVDAVLPAVGDKPLAEEGAVVTWTVTLINGDTAVPAGNLSLEVNSTDAAYAAAPITCDSDIALGLTASSAVQCSFPVTVTEAHINATEMPAFTVRAVDSAAGGGYPLEHAEPAMKLYTVASMTADAPVITSNATTYINGECAEWQSLHACSGAYAQCSHDCALIVLCSSSFADASSRAADKS